MQRFSCLSCQRQNPLMLRLFTCLSIAAALLVIACSKNSDGNESVLYGRWSKGTNVADTLEFMNKGGKNILRFNGSFNPAVPATTEVEYSYKKGRLSVAVFGPGEAPREIESFTWKQQNKQFDILGFQLYIIMSSSTTHFTYTKID